MQLRDFHGPVTVLRDVILRELARGFGEHSGVTPATAHWPWEVGNGATVTLLEDEPFIDGTEDSPGCHAICRFEVLFAAGAPGADHVGPLADHWSNYVAGRRPLRPIVNDPLWVPQAPVPVFERVGGFRFLQVNAGQELWAAQSVLRTEIHLES